MEPQQLRRAKLKWLIYTTATTFLPTLTVILCWPYMSSLWAHFMLCAIGLALMTPIFIIGVKDTVTTMDPAFQGDLLDALTAMLRDHLIPLVAYSRTGLTLGLVMAAVVGIYHYH